MLVDEVDALHWNGYHIIKAININNLTIELEKQLQQCMHDLMLGP